MSSLDLEFDLDRTQEPIGPGENESDAVLLERRWFAAHKAAHTMRAECVILREVMHTAHANWRDARAKLANLDALCSVLEDEYARYVERRFVATPAVQVERMSAA
jgi:hypothetical protein